MIHTDWDSQRERLSAYLDSELPASERADLDAHLPGCDECQRELAALRQMRGLLRALPTPALPRSFTLPEEPASPTRRRGVPPRWARPAQALGGLAAAVGLGLLVASALPHPAIQTGSAAMYGPDITAGGASSGALAAANPTGAAASGTAPAPSATTAPTYGPEHSPAFKPQMTPSAQPFPTLPVTGGTLLVGGAAAFTLGSLARRRARGAVRAAPGCPRLSQWISARRRRPPRRW